MGVDGFGALGRQILLKLWGFTELEELGDKYS